MSEPYKRTNPLIWGAVAAIIAGALISLSLMTVETSSTEPILNKPLWTVGGAFFWGWVAGNAKNWYGKRISGQ